MAVSDDAVAVGDTVHTPDGKGKIASISDRYVDVTLESGEKRVFGHRDIYADEKMQTPKVVNPPTPEPAAPAEPSSAGAPNPTAPEAQ